MPAFFPSLFILHPSLRKQSFKLFPDRPDAFRFDPSRLSSQCCTGLAAFTRHTSLLRPNHEYSVTRVASATINAPLSGRVNTRFAFLPFDLRPNAQSFNMDGRTPIRFAFPHDLAFIGAGAEATDTSERPPQHNHANIPSGQAANAQAGYRGGYNSGHQGTTLPYPTAAAPIGVNSPASNGGFSTDTGGTGGTPIDADPHAGPSNVHDMPVTAAAHAPLMNFGFFSRPPTRLTADTLGYHQYQLERSHKLDIDCWIDSFGVGSRLVAGPFGGFGGIPSVTAATGYAVGGSSVGGGADAGAGVGDGSVAPRQ